MRRRRLDLVEAAVDPGLGVVVAVALAVVAQALRDLRHAVSSLVTIIPASPMAPRFLVG
jgi:hypothetical protein